MHLGNVLPAMRSSGIRALNALALAWITAVLLLAVSSCASQSVRHLKQHPWSLDKPQMMRTNYLRFHFVCSQDPEGLQVQGTAHPLQDGPIPDWGTWARDLWMGAYLSDRSGRVLAQEIQVLPPQRLTQDQPISFTFVLQPHSMGEPGPVFISFGYRLVLAPSPAGTETKDNGPRDNSPVFFASESALTRF